MNIYQQNIIDQYKNPQNFRIVDGYTHTAKVSNSTCGDEITVFLKVNNDKIEDISFQGSGCAISVSAISMLTEELKGKSISEIEKIDDKYIQDKLLGISVNPGRIGCVMIGKQAIERALEK